MVLVSCAGEGQLDVSKGTGQLCMRMSIDPQTRSSLTDEELLTTAVVNIYKADFSGLVRTYSYSSMPSSIYLAADSYRVDVLAGEIVTDEPSKASWEQKSYKGSAMFEIVPDKTDTVEVVANVSNAVTLVTFDSTVEQNFDPGYTFTIGLGSEDAQLIYDAGKSGAEGYFIISGIDEPIFTWTFAGTLTKKGTLFTKTGTIQDLVPGKMYKMNVVYTVRDGEFNFSIHVDPVIDEIDDTIVFEPVSTGLSVSSICVNFCTLRAPWWLRW